MERTAAHCTHKHTAHTHTGQHEAIVIEFPLRQLVDIDLKLLYYSHHRSFLLFFSPAFISSHQLAPDYR